MWQVLELVAYSETGKFRSRLCQLSSHANTLMLTVSSACSRVFTQYNNCVNCRRNSTDRTKPHACKRYCNISREEKAAIALDYHLMVRLKNPKLLAARFVYGVTTYKTQCELLASNSEILTVTLQKPLRTAPHCPDVAALHEIYHTHRLYMRKYAACYAGDMSAVDNIITQPASYYSSESAYLFRMACTRTNTNILERFITRVHVGRWYTRVMSPSAFLCLQYHKKRVLTQQRGIHGVLYTVDLRDDSA